MRQATAAARISRRAALEGTLALSRTVAKIHVFRASLASDTQMVTELTDTNFQSTLQAAKVPVLVDFSASWCQPCKALAPTIDKVAGEYRGRIDVYKIDIDNAQDSAAGLGIMSVPTCVFFRDGKEVDRFTGNVDLRTVKSHVDRVLG